jgi:PBP1b-binding outer membrane lipoprotein LpoB
MKFIKILVLLGFLTAVFVSCSGQTSPYDDQGSTSMKVSAGAVR